MPKKVKDIKCGFLEGTKVRIPKKYEDFYQGIKGEMYIHSFWNNGVWFKKTMKSDRVYPLTMNPHDLLEFTVVK